MLAALAEDWCMLSPCTSVQARAVDTDRLMATLPATPVLPMMRMIYLDGFRGGSSSPMSGRRWTRTCGVAGRGGRADKSISALPLFAELAREEDVLSQLD